MPTQTLTRAWTDLDFRASLTADELDLLSHPAGDLDAELDQLIIRDPSVASVDTTWTHIPFSENCCC